MGIFSNLFKKKNTTSKKLILHMVELKNINKKALSTLFIGQIVSIDTDYKEDKDGLVDEETVSYNLVTYPKHIKIGSLRSNDESYGEEYSYAILKEISDNKIIACIICNNVYLSRIKISTEVQIDNGTVLEIAKCKTEYCLKMNGRIVGKVVDNRVNDTMLLNMSYLYYDNGCATAIIFK